MIITLNDIRDGMQSLHTLDFEQYQDIYTCALCICSGYIFVMKDGKIRSLYERDYSDSSGFFLTLKAFLTFKKITEDEMDRLWTEYLVEQEEEINKQEKHQLKELASKLGYKLVKEKDFNKNQPQFCLYCGDRLSKKEKKICSQCEE